MGFLIGFVLGVLASLMATIFYQIAYERARRPNLRLEIGDYADGKLHPQAPSHRFLHVRVRNDKNRRLWSWITQPDTAVSCMAYLTFVDMSTETQTFDAIHGRWAGAPELLLPAIVQQGQQPVVGNLFDSTKLPIGRKIDIPAGQSEMLDVAIKHDLETMCYAFTNESYGFGLKNPQWALQRGTYRVQVLVISGTVQMCQSFILRNPSKQISDFVLEQDV